MKKLNLKLAPLILLVVFSITTITHADLLDDKQLELRNLQKKIEEHEATLKKVRDQKLTLNNQVKLLDEQAQSARLSLEAIGTEIEALGLEKSALNRDLVDLEEKALDQKLILQKAVKKAYIARKSGALEILITSTSLAAFMTHLEYLDTIQNHISIGLSKLNDLKKELGVKKAVLEDKDERLSEIKSEKAIEEQSLQIQLDAKAKIMKDLKLSESEYQSKLDAARAEQQAVSNTIAALIKSSEQGQKFSGELKLAWPISSRIITATFQDPDYLRRFGIPHSGLDIATPQGTPIKNPYEGTVTKVYDGGMGLSYIVVIHNNGLSTAYLHVSSFAVSKGAYVAQGQVLGYTGGTPGTPGAGWLTTGPHLHIEVWYQGTARNPLAYLVG